MDKDRLLTPQHNKYNVFFKVYVSDGARYIQLNVIVKCEGLLEELKVLSVLHINHQHCG